MSYSQYFLHNLIDMASLEGTILETILNYKRESPMSTVQGSFISPILTVAHMDPQKNPHDFDRSAHTWLMTYSLRLNFRAHKDIGWASKP